MMRLHPRRPAFAAVLLLAISWIVAAGQSNDAATAMISQMATRLYTGADGQSHIDQVAIPLHANGGVNSRADSDALKMDTAFLVRAAPGMFEPWHNADQKRYIVVLSGEAEITTTGGEKARFVPGHLYIAEDLTGKGHTFRVVGNQEWVALFVNFAQ